MSVVYRRPLREIAYWPSWEVRLLDYYLQHQPAPDERVEIAVATLCAMFFNVHRAKEYAPRSMKDYLPFLDPWPVLGRYSDLDREVMAALGQ